MKYPNSIEVYDLEYKIDEKLHKIHKRKNQLSRTNTKIKNHNNVVHQMKWQTIKNYIHRPPKEHKNIQVIRPALKQTDLLDTINRIMLLEKSIIELANDIATYRRMQMLCIFFQCSLAIVFNAYNLVVFLLKMANESDDVPLTPAMLLLFYGYHIISSMCDIILTVIIYSGVFEGIRKTATKMDELNMYIFDSDINSRISQLSTYIFNNLRTFTLFGLYNIDGTLVTSILGGTATYIIILIQYSGDGEICNSEHLKMNDSQNAALNKF